MHTPRPGLRLLQVCFAPHMLKATGLMGDGIMTRMLTAAATALCVIFAPDPGDAQIIPADNPASPARVAQNTLELKSRLENWKARPHLYCDEDGKHFPSKMKDPPKWSCDDGDMTLFNGLLCLAGVEDGCKAVRDSQARDGDGAWWRSPKKVDRPDTSSPRDENHQTSFNSDQSLGIYAYLSQTGDRDAFGKWLTRLADNGVCTHLATSKGDKEACGWPTYPLVCKNGGDCSFRPIDCAMVALFGALLGETVAGLTICDPSRIIGVPTPDDVLARAMDFADGELKSARLVATI